MMKRTLMMSTLVAALVLFSGFAFAADQDKQIYGSQLMTQQERAEYHAKMRSVKTIQEREQIRNEHHEQMQERAKERGLTLPDEPPGRGGGWVAVAEVWDRVVVVPSDIACTIRIVGGLEVGFASFLNFRGIALNPPIDGRVVNLYPRSNIISSRSR